MSRSIVSIALVLVLPLSAIIISKPTDARFLVPIDGGSTTVKHAVTVGRDFHFIGVLGLSRAVVGGLSGRLEHNAVSRLEFGDNAPRTLQDVGEKISYRTSSAPPF